MPARSPVPPLHVRAMAPGDVPTAAAVLHDGGWGERSAFFRHLLTVSDCQVLVGEVEERVVATGVASVFGRVGWVGTIFVDPALRLRGYGRAITEAVCERLEASGCETLLLIASDLGQPVYERMGFRVDAWHETYRPTATPHDDQAAGTGGGLPEGPGAAARGIRVRTAAAADLSAVFDLDRIATGSDRHGLLASIANRIWVAERDGAIAGLLASMDAGSSAIVAPDREIAAPLLRHAARVAPRALGTATDGNPVQQEVLRAHGWEPFVRSPRMVRGATIEWRPDWVWGILGRAFG